MTRFIGIDLAWSERNPSGFAVLRGDGLKGGVRLTESALVHSDKDIRDAVKLASGDTDCLLAIDGPIIAPNAAGTSRACDKAVSRDFGRFHAGTYPANRELSVRPIRLRKACSGMGSVRIQVFHHIPLAGGSSRSSPIPRRWCCSGASESSNTKKAR